MFETAKKDSVKLKLSYMLHDDEVLRRDFWIAFNNTSPQDVEGRMAAMKELFGKDTHRG